MDYQEPTYDYNLGENKLPDEVIAIAAARAVLDTKGVAELSGGIGNSISKTLLRKEQLSKGMKIDQTDEGINLDVYIVVYYGARIPEIAWQIQKNVKNSIQQLTERKVLAVNVHVQGVKEKDNKKDKK
jgi:uncharacterized alkaline shock family protein YloU